MKSSITIQKRTILEEEQYQATLSDIISRHYFPEVEELQKQVERQRRCEADNICGNTPLLRKDGSSAGQTYNGREIFEQSGTDLFSDGLVVGPRPLHLENLSNFHARVTSEDNASFDQAQNDEIRHHAKIDELSSVSTYRKKSAHPVLRSNSHVMSPLPLASEQFDPPSHQCSISAFKKESSNNLFFVPEPRQKLDPRMLAIACPPDNSRLCTQDRTINSTQTMFPPTSCGGIISKNIFTSQKKIVPSATRFPSKAFAFNPVLNNSWDVESQPDHWSSTDVGSEITDLDSYPGFPLNVEKMQAMKRRNRDLSKFVRMTPLIVPGARGTEESSPLVTWGTVEGTPLVVPNLDTTVPPTFQLPQMSTRDDAATKAHEKLFRGPKSSQQANAVLRAQRSMKPVSDNLSAVKPHPMSARSAKSLGSALRKSYLRMPVSAQRESSRISKPASADTAYQLTPHLPRNLG